MNELDNRGSTFYLTLYWAQALAAQTSAPDLAARFGSPAAALAENEARIVEELNDAQGPAQDLGGLLQTRSGAGRRGDAAERHP